MTESSRDERQPAPAVVAGEAAAAAVEVHAEPVPLDPRAAAFFDIDNTIVRGASLFHLARGLATRKFFTAGDVTAFAWKQAKFRVAGREDTDDMASAVDAALAFVAGHTRRRGRLTLATRSSTNESRDKLYAGTIELAHDHLAPGNGSGWSRPRPVEMASIIARKLGLTGALGTVSEIVDGVYTGRLVGCSTARSGEGRSRTSPGRARGSRPCQVRGVLGLVQRHSDALAGRPAGRDQPRRASCAAMPERMAGAFTTTGPDARPRRSGSRSARGDGRRRRHRSWRLDHKAQGTLNDACSLSRRRRCGAASAACRACAGSSRAPGR